MKTFVLAGAFATLAFLPAAAQPGSMQSAASRCLHFDNIQNWKALDDRTLLVEDTYHNNFRVALATGCEGLQFKERVSFRQTAPVHLTCLGSGDDVTVRQLGTTAAFAHCPIATITPVSQPPTGSPQ